MKGKMTTKSRKGKLVAKTIAKAFIYTFVAILVLCFSLGIILYKSGWVHEQIRRLAESNLTKHAGRECSFGVVEGSLFSDITFNNLVIAQDKTLDSGTCMDVEKLVVHYNLLDFFKGDIRLRSIEVINPHIYLGRDSEGRWPLKEVFYPSKEREGPSKFKMQIDNIYIRNCYYSMDVDSPLSQFAKVDIHASFRVDRGISVINVLQGNLYLPQVDTDINLFEGRIVVGKGTVLLDDIKLANDTSSLSTIGLIEYWGRVHYTFATDDLRIPGEEVCRIFLGGKNVVSGMLNVKGNIEGERDWVDMSGLVENDQGTLLGYPLKDLTAQVNYELGHLTLEPFSLKLGEGQLSGKAEVLHGGGDSSYLMKGTLSDVNISSYQRTVNINSSLNGEFLLAGSGWNFGEIDADIELNFTSSTLGNIQFDNGECLMELKGRSAVISGLFLHKGESTLAASGEMEFDGSLDLDILSEAIRAEYFLPSLGYPQGFGEVATNIHFGGSFNSPVVFGDMWVTDGGWGDTLIKSARFSFLIDDPLTHPVGRVEISARDVEVWGTKIYHLYSDLTLSPTSINLENIALSLENNIDIIGNLSISRGGAERKIIFSDVWVLHPYMTVVALDQASLTLHPGGFEVSPLQMELLGGKLKSDGIDIDQQSISGDLLLTKLNLENLLHTGFTKVPLAGRLNFLNLQFSGPLGNPDISLTFNLVNGPLVGMDNSIMEGDINYIFPAIMINALDFQMLNQRVSASGEIPFNLAGTIREGFSPQTGMDIHLEIANLDLGLINLLTDEVYISRGKAAADLTLTGNLLKPEVVGYVQVEDTDLAIGRIGSEIRNLEVELFLTNNLVSVHPDKPLLADMDQGTLKAWGTIYLPIPLGMPTFDVSISADGIVLRGIPQVTGIVSASGKLEGTPGKNLTASGEVLVHEGLVTMEFFTSRSGYASSLNSMDIHLDIYAKNNVWLRNSSADIEFSCDMALSRESGRYEISGKLSAIRGYFYFFKRDFSIDKGSIVFQGTNQINPLLDITGAIDIRSNKDKRLYPVYIYVTGELKKPEIRLSSPDYPALTQQDILTILALNMTWDEFEQMQGTDIAASQSTEYIMRYVEDEISRYMRKGIGLDTVRIHTNLISGEDEESLRFTVGKYVTRQLYFSFTRDIYTAEGQAIQAEYYLTDDFSLIGETHEEDGEYIHSFSIKYRYRY